MKFLGKNKTVAFTLIEVMVVITIVGLLASVVMAAMVDARAKARDATRVATVKELQKALELYRDANGGKYPCSTAMPLCLSGGAQININGTIRTAFFDTAINPYLKLPNEAIVFPTHLTWGSIIYRTGGTTAAPVLDSYTILLRRERTAKGRNGDFINAGSFCDIRVGTRPSNTWPDANYINCF